MGKVLLIGWDAADWKVITPLVDQGKMPHTRRLIEQGVMGRLTTIQPALSPMLWTSIATGKRPFRHGILGFSEPTPDGSGIRPITQLSRTTKTIWNILNQNELRSHVIGWWPSYPVEPINGVMVAHGFQQAHGPQEEPWPFGPGMVHPERLSDTLADLRLNPNELILDQIRHFVPAAAEIDQDNDPRLAMVMKTLAECATIHALATYAMQNEPWDFMAVYYDSIDHFCHGFMRYHPPRLPHVPEDDYEKYRRVVEAGYCFHDMMLGVMLQMAPEDTSVVICSDHGFHPDHLRPTALPMIPAGPALEHQDLGILIVSGPCMRRDELIHGASVLDITPTLLTLLGLPVGEDMDGKVLVEAFESPPDIKTVPSWDTVAGNDARHSGESRFDPFAATLAMDQLVAMGYVEPLADDREAAVTSTVNELQFNLARSYMDAGLHGKAVPILTELYEANTEQYRYGIQLCMCYRALNDPKALRALVERLTADRKAGCVDARKRLVEFTEAFRKRKADEMGVEADTIRFTAEDLEASETEAYRKLTAQARFNMADLEYLTGWVLIAEKKHDEALEHLLRAHKAEPRRMDLLLQLGHALLMVNRPAEAEQSFQSALDLDECKAAAHLGLSRALLRRKEVARSVQHALRAIQLRYDNPLGHFMLGRGLWSLRKFADAAQAIRVAVDQNPNFERAHRLLAFYEARVAGNAEKSTEHLRVAREIRAARSASGAHAETLAADPDGTSGSAATTTASEPAQVLPASVDKGAVPATWKDCITVVSGLPRSGTSMMMQMLSAAGIPAFCDDARGPDEDNPKGYFESESVKRLARDNAWLGEAKGMAVKIVAPLLPHLLVGQFYRIVFMERSLDEVMRSQAAMLERVGQAAKRSGQDGLKAAWERRLHQLRVWLAMQPHIKVLFVSHQAAMREPLNVASDVAAFLGDRFELSAMAAVVESTLYRQKGITITPQSEDPH